LDGKKRRFRPLCAPLGRGRFRVAKHTASRIFGPNQAIRQIFPQFPCLPSFPKRQFCCSLQLERTSRRFGFGSPKEGRAWARRRWRGTRPISTRSAGPRTDLQHAPDQSLLSSGTVPPGRSRHASRGIAVGRGTPLHLGRGLRFDRNSGRRRSLRVAVLVDAGASRLRDERPAARRRRRSAGGRRP
jgi:hypothetical protein